MYPIPPHLAELAWYASHQAWLALKELDHHEFPKGTRPVRADLAGEDLSNTNFSNAILYDANLSGVYFSGAHFYNANLSRANLFNANLAGAYLSRADLSRADLSYADISGAELYNANLSRAILFRVDLSRANLFHANFSGAHLSGARGVVAFGPVGHSLRIGYATAGPDDAQVHLGCFWGTQSEAVRQIRKAYGDGSAYEQLVVAACRVVQEQRKDA